MWEAEYGGRWEGFSSAGGCLIQNPPTAFLLSSVQLIVGRKKKKKKKSHFWHLHSIHFYKDDGRIHPCSYGQWSEPNVWKLPSEKSLYSSGQMLKTTHVCFSWQKKKKKKKPFYSRRNNDFSLCGAESEVISGHKNLSERKGSRWRTCVQSM